MASPDIHSELCEEISARLEQQGYGEETVRLVMRAMRLDWARRSGAPKVIVKDFRKLLRETAVRATRSR